MENGVLARRSVDRALAGRRAAYAEEVRRLVEASFSLIRDQGELEPRVGAIVRAAGLSNQAFYRHFRSKDELLLTVLDEGVGRLSAYLRHRMQSVESPEAKVRAWIDGMLEQVLNPEAAAATRPFAVSRTRLSELFSEEVAESERQLTALLRQAIQAAMESGVWPEAEPERDAETVYHLAMGWMQQKLAKPSSPQRADAQHLSDFALHGLRRGARPVPDPG